MTLCHDTNQLVLCGDTAQTISRVGFRFEDLRTLFYMRAAADKQAGVAEANRTAVPDISSLTISKTQLHLLPPTPVNFI